MNMHVEPLEERDYPQLLEFLDRCFAPAATGFDTLLPSLFTDHSSCTACNYAVRDNGKLIGVAGVYPIEWQVGHTVLRMSGIGNVAVDPDRRGEGLMSRLMRHIVQIMPGLGFDLSWLGGYRQRYAQFGYEKAGLLQQFFVTPANIRSMNISDDQIRARRFDPVVDAKRIPQFKALYDRQTIRCVRSEHQFRLHLRNGRRLTWLAEGIDGTLQGYAVTTENGQLVTEIIAANLDSAKALVSHLVHAAASEKVEFQCNALAGEVGQLLNAIAEHRYLTTNGNWLIFDWPKVMGALLRAHHDHCVLPDGSVVVGIEDQHSTLKLSVDAGDVNCEWTNEGPDLTADPLTMTRMLLGPGNPSQMVALTGKTSILSAWCPLPAGFSPQDYV